MIIHEIPLNEAEEFPDPYSEHEVPLSEAESFPDPASEDDIIGRMDAAEDAKKIFSSDRVNNRAKVVLALRHGIFPVELKGVRVKAGEGEKTLAELVNNLPDYPEGVTQKDLGVALGITERRAAHLEQRSLRSAKKIVRTTPNHSL